MTRLDLGATTTPTETADYETPSETTEGAAEQKETILDNNNFHKWYGKYKSIAKIKIAIKAYATWVVGLGWKANARTTAILENIRGMGEDSFMSFLWNMLVIKKVNGQSFAEIMRNEETGTLINIKPLDPASIITILNREGIIERYEQISKVKKPNKRIPVEKMLHLINDRVADDGVGDSVIEAVEWNIEAQEEARRAYRKLVKNNGVVRVIEIDSQDTAKIAAFKVQWKEALENGDVLLIPKDVAEAKDWHGTIDTQGVLVWLNYLDDEFYQMIGIPKIIIGGSGDIEGDSKVSYLSFEPIYKRAINELKDDLWNQLALRVDFNLPPSLKTEIASNEQKNASQTGFQPNDTEAGVGA